MAKPSRFGVGTAERRKSATSFSLSGFAFSGTQKHKFRGAFAICNTFDNEIGREAHLKSRPRQDAKTKLRAAGLRLTRQRTAVEKVRTLRCSNTNRTGSCCRKTFARNF